MTALENTEGKAAKSPIAATEFSPAQKEGHESPRPMARAEEPGMMRNLGFPEPEVTFPSNSTQREETVGRGSIDKEQAGKGSIEKQEQGKGSIEKQETGKGSIEKQEGTTGSIEKEEWNKVAGIDKQENGKQSIDKLSDLDKELHEENGDQKEVPQFRAEHDESGRTTKVYDSDGKVVRSVEYNEDGSVKQIDGEDALHGRYTIKPTPEGGTEWTYFDGDGNPGLTINSPEKATVDADGNVILSQEGFPVDRKFDPEGGMTEQEPGREDWEERMKGGKFVTNDDNMTEQVLDGDGNPIRTIKYDDQGAKEVEDADGVKYVRNEDGSWSHLNKDGDKVGTVYNLVVDAQGNISYEANFQELANEKVPAMFKTFPRRRISMYTNGYTREGPAN